MDKGRINMVEEKIILGNTVVGFSMQYADEIKMKMENIMLLFKLKEIMVETEEDKYTHFTRYAIIVGSHQPTFNMRIVLTIKQGVFDNAHFIVGGIQELHDKFKNICDDRVKYTNSRYYTYSEEGLMDSLKLIEEIAIQM